MKESRVCLYRFPTSGVNDGHRMLRNILGTKWMKLSGEHVRKQTLMVERTSKMGTQLDRFLTLRPPSPGCTTLTFAVHTSQSLIALTSRPANNGAYRADDYWGQNQRLTHDLNNLLYPPILRFMGWGALWPQLRSRIRQPCAR